MELFDLVRQMIEARGLTLTADMEVEMRREMRQYFLRRASRAESCGMLDARDTYRNLADEVEG